MEDRQIEIIRKDFEKFSDKRQLEHFLNDLCSAYPDLSGIFVTNSRAHLIVDCLNKFRKADITIIGFDLIEPNLKYLQDNKISFLINQNPVEQGFQGLVSLFNHLILKENVDQIQYLPLDIVVKENVSYYLKKQKALNAVV